jgi:hypothetical protein
MLETMMLSISSKSVVVPKGEYVLGDPCYVVPNDDWSDLLNSCNYFNHPVGRVRDFNILGFGTKWGDGCYRDTKGNVYPVDAGLIGLVPVAYAEVEPDSVIVSFSEPTLCQNDDGILKFGSYVIDTVLVEDEE